MKRGLFIFVLILGIILFISGCVGTQPTSLIQDIKNANLVVWMHPHGDDEVYVPGVLATAMEVGTPASCWYIGSGPLKDSPSTNPTKIANMKNSKLLNLKEYAYIGAKQTEIVNKLRKEKPDVVITFEPTNGFSNQQHANSAVKAREAIIESGIETKLYYMLGKDEDFIELISRKSIDPGEPTDIIDLDTYSSKAGMTYWDIQMELYKNYGTLDYCKGEIECSSNIDKIKSQIKKCCSECKYSAFKGFSDCPELLNQRKHEEYYMRIQ